MAFIDSFILIGYLPGVILVGLGLSFKNESIIFSLGEAKQICKRSFTLIELLIVIATLAILLSILFPSLRKAKEESIEALCLSNLKQCSTALAVYQSENNGFLTKSSANNVHPADVFRSLENESVTRVNIIPLLKPYLQTFSVWKCSFLDSAADIDDEANTFPEYRRGTYMYWANLNGVGGKILNSHRAKQSPRNALMSDVAYTFNDKWRTAHDDGSGDLYQFWDNMPSLKLFRNGRTRNLNQVYADGSAKKNRKIKPVYYWEANICYAANNTEFD